MFCAFTYAQDTIVKSTGEQLCVKITEVSEIEVKYKKFDFLDGPTFIENKSNIQLIKYSNGSKEDFGSPKGSSKIRQTEIGADYYNGPVNQSYKIERYGNHFRYQGKDIKEHVLHDVLYKSGDKQIIFLAGNAEDAKGLQYIGFGAVPLGIGAFYFLIRNYNFRSGGSPQRDVTLAAFCFIGAVSCPVGSIYFKHKRNVSNREAIKLYNASY